MFFFINLPNDECESPDVSFENDIKFLKLEYISVAQDKIEIIGMIVVCKAKENSHLHNLG